LTGPVGLVNPVPEGSEDDYLPSVSFFSKDLNLAVRRILIRRRELIQFIGKPDPKTIHHNYKPLQLHLQLKPIGLGHRRRRTLVSWIGTSTRPHHCPGRIRISIQTSTLPGWIGTSTRASTDLRPVRLVRRHDPQRINSARLDWVIDTRSPIAANASSQAQQPTAREAARTH